MVKYTQEIEVRYSDIGPEGYADVAQIMTWFQDAATSQSQFVGYGANALRAMGAAWIVLHWDIRMYAHARHMEKLKVSTWASGFASMYGHRMFTLENEAGELIAEAESVWILYDMQNNKFMKATEEICTAYGCDVKMPMDVLRKWKLSVPASPTHQASWTVRRSDTDTNQHTNNVSYVKFLIDSLEKGGEVRHVRVTYKKALFLHETAQLLLDATSGAILRGDEICTLFEFEY